MSVALNLTPNLSFTVTLPNLASFWESVSRTPFVTIIGNLIGLLSILTAVAIWILALAA